ncbi:uncharacterized protein LOC123224325 [Mangifera indica]|uniref:uncharacterized protein LOC123224325 n=1 Tax=Mangifera indica TaxID=29780 RepID=UPI001CFBC5CA|nr:uncharacterized protein LOC123224325 [Mangifera indica]
MKKRAKVNGKSSSSASPESPNRSPKSNKIASASAPKQKSNYKYKKPMASALLSPSPPPRAPMNFGNKTLSNISDLKEMAFSRLDDLKRNLIERSHSEILKDLEASHSRLHKRFKIQTQTCQQMKDEAEKEYKKMTERISKSQEAMKASYVEIMEDAQATASNVCKKSIPEIASSFEKAIGALQSRFGIQST